MIMTLVRPPAVAGMFYPGDRTQLDHMVRHLLDAVPVSPDSPPPKALIAPHAGYPYSGTTAAMAYARLKPVAEQINRVVLIGPSHRVPFQGLALTSADAYSTPLGRVPLDKDTAARLETLPQVITLDAAHAQEHSLEVHLPFLQELLPAFTLLPLVAGAAQPEDVAAVLTAVWGGAETLIVISSDLTHDLDYDTARQWDRRTCDAVEALDEAAIGDQQACGRIPMCGLLHLARQRGMAVETLALCNSGDTAGSRDRVVGYGAWSFTEPAEAQP